MPNMELTLEILTQIQDAAQKVVQRFQIINKPNDFSDTSAGMEKVINDLKV